MVTDRSVNTNKKFKNTALELASKAEEIITQQKEKQAILLCEGTEESIDIALYAVAYPQFVVFPVGGCTDIRKLMPFMKKYSEYQTFGLIDRDNCSKFHIKMLQSKDSIYCTKLPFIENIICCPEALKWILKEEGQDYKTIIKEVRADLASILAEKMSLLNPFNVALPVEKEVQYVSITIVTKQQCIRKTIDLANIMYTFRDKAIVGKVADAMGLHGREAYYQLVKKLLRSEKGEELMLIMAKYLPNIVPNKDIS